ncbi:MAG: FTR1 family iron permease [Hydromonas sp.]|nr:FTR1 family iron permease [Hydromonas sp.]
MTIFSRSKRVLLNLMLALSIGTIAPTIALAQTTTASHSNQNEPVNKKLNLSPLFVDLSDAMGASKHHDFDQAKVQLTQINRAFSDLESRDSPMGKQVATALQQALQNPSSEHLSALSSALYEFEREQNPVDHSAKRKIFKTQIVPAYERLNQVINRAASDNIAELQQAYQQFNRVWLSNERVVRNTSMGHYGSIETAMALMRVAIESSPPNIDKIKQQSLALKTALDSYHSGETAVVTQSTHTLNDGTQLLREGFNAFQANNISQGQDKLTRFIEIWPSIEGDVSTRNPALYSRIESQIPVILAKGNEPMQQNALNELISELASINPNQQYSAVDAMLILLREGVEAMLIVIALISALNVAKQPQGKKWVYAGVLAGLLASVIGAIVLQRLFPAVTAGTHREVLEGFIGLFVVVMMLMIGTWLHSKSSLQSWNAYITKHMGKALTTGSLVSLFGLSFLSVFREGAETIVFYAGILPKISMNDFLTGIFAALLVLAVLAVLLLKTSIKLPIAKLFNVLTWVIYALGFKILGISVHALQLTGYLSLTSVQNQWLENSDLGLFATVETLSAQAMYILIILVIQWYFKRNTRPSTVAQTQS